MRLLLGEAHDLILDGGTVAWADAFDEPVEHGSAMEVGADDLVRLTRRVHEVARHLRAPGRGSFRQRRESAARGVTEEEGCRGAGLHLGEAPVDRVAVEPRGRARL